MDVDDFDELTGLLDYPMFIVTTVGDGNAAGCLVGFVTQASIDPPRFLVGLSNKNHTYDVALNASRLAVHLIDGRCSELARLFGESTGDDVNKFARCSWQPDSHGVPLLDEAPAWFSGSIRERISAGDHTAFLIDVDAAEVRSRPSRLLQLSDVQNFEPGHPA